MTLSHQVTQACFFLAQRKSRLRRQALVEFGDYEAAAYEIAANGVNKVWECYAAGLNPTNATDLFRTVISISDGKPQISWEPRLSAEEETRRTYTIYGRESLTGGEWTTPTNAASRFFKVKVTLP